MSEPQTPDELGELVTRHGASLWVKAWFWVSVLLLPASIVVFRMGLAREWNDNIIAVSFVVAIIALVAIIQLWRMGRRWAEIREHGFVLGRGRTPLQSVRWTDVVSVRKTTTQQYINGIKTRLIVTGWVATRDGQTITLGYLVPDVADVIEAIESACYPGIYEASVAALNEGQTVEFGALGLNLGTGPTLSVPVMHKGSVAWQRTPIGWNEIEQAYLHDGKLRLRRYPDATGPTPEVALDVGSIANFPVAWDLISRVLSQRSS